MQGSHHDFPINKKENDNATRNIFSEENKIIKTPSWEIKHIWKAPKQKFLKNSQVPTHFSLDVKEIKANKRNITYNILQDSNTNFISCPNSVDEYEEIKNAPLDSSLNQHSNINETRRKMRIIKDKNLPKLKSCHNLITKEYDSIVSDSVLDEESWNSSVEKYKTDYLIDDVYNTEFMCGKTVSCNNTYFFILKILSDNLNIIEC